MKNIINEMKQVTWLTGRQLMKDTGYVLLFCGILLAYFTVVDNVLKTVIDKFFLR